MLTSPPGLPMPSAPAKCFTIDGASGMRLSTGGREPAFTCSARLGVSSIFTVGAARAITGARTVSATPAVKSRRFIVSPRPAVLVAGRSDNARASSSLNDGPQHRVAGCNLWPAGRSGLVDLDAQRRQDFSVTFDFARHVVGELGRQQADDLGAVVAREGLE